MATRLSNAMSEALKVIHEGGFAWDKPPFTRSTENALVYRGMIVWTPAGYKLTPRGHAALAAPRMTAKEYLCLRFYGGEPGLEDHGLKAFDSCVSKGWCTRGGKTISDVLTPSGLKALNDVRAATGSELYREDLK